MKIIYDRSIPVVGLGIFPWTRLGPERWFDNYTIVSLFDWDAKGVSGAPRVISFTDRAPSVPVSGRLKMQTLISMPAFQEILKSLPRGSRFLSYKPLTIPPELAMLRKNFLAVNQKIAQKLENKAEFRLLFKDRLRFPPFRILERDAVASGQVTLHDILQDKDEVIMQDEQLSGGRGTFTISDEASLTQALHRIGTLGGRRLVVSEKISPMHERSVQCCVTRYGVFIGPLQKQIVGNPLLAKMKIAEGDKFCGGELGANDPFAAAYPDIRRMAQIVGNELQSMGYKGIFGIDCLVSDTGEVYILEVNPRITGMTPLLTMLYRGEQDIPFYLLHILELGGYEYTIQGQDQIDTPAVGAMILAHSLKNAPFQIVNAPRSGLYRPRELTFQKQALHFDAALQTPQMLVQRYAPLHATMKEGFRTLSVFFNRGIMDNNDRIKMDVQQDITTILNHIETTEDV